MLKLKIYAKVMSTVMLDIRDCPVNGQTGNISHVEFAQGSVQKVSVKCLDQQAGLKAIRWSYLGRQNSWAAIEKYKAEVPKKKESASSSIKYTQFPLILPWASPFIWFKV